MITLLAENNSSATPSVEELQAWADSFGLNHPVVADADWGITFGYVSGGSVGLPSQHLIAPGGEIVAVNSHGIGAADIAAILP